MTQGLVLPAATIVSHLSHSVLVWPSARTIISLCQSHLPVPDLYRSLFKQAQYGEGSRLLKDQHGSQEVAQGVRSYHLEFGSHRSLVPVCFLILSITAIYSLLNSNDVNLLCLRHSFILFFSFNDVLWFNLFFVSL